MRFHLPKYFEVTPPTGTPAKLIFKNNSSNSPHALFFFFLLIFEKKGKKEKLT